MNQLTTYRWSLEEDLENYEQAGYRAIGVWRQKLTEPGEDRAVDLLIESNLQVTSLSCAGGFTGMRGLSLAESIDDAADAIRLAAAMQAGCLLIYPGSRNHHTWRHANRLLRSALDRLLPIAEDCDVCLAMEPIHASCAQGWTFLTDLSSVVQVVGEYRCPQLGWAFDTYHSQWGPAERDIVLENSSRLSLVFLGDRNCPPNVDQECCPLGGGHLPMQETIASLFDAGYAGPFEVRLTGPEIEACNNWTLLQQSQAAAARWLHADPARSLV